MQVLVRRQIAVAALRTSIEEFVLFFDFQNGRTERGPNFLLNGPPSHLHLV